MKFSCSSPYILPKLWAASNCADLEHIILFPLDNPTSRFVLGITIMRKWYGFALIELLVVIAIDIIYTERKTQAVQETYIERT
jgi:hypothetical protein